MPSSAGKLPWVLPRCCLFIICLVAYQRSNFDQISLNMMVFGKDESAVVCGALR
jgi:hypothetical protein